MKTSISIITSLLFIATFVSLTCAFPSTPSFTKAVMKSASTSFTQTKLRDTAQVEQTIGEQYPIFTKLIMGKNANLWKTLSDASAEGFTMFALNDSSMQALGEKKLSQLDDVRNDETVEKIASFHAIGERVSADDLYNSGGVITVGGVIDVGRTVTGGFMGIGGKEDGGVTINGAKILQTIEVDNCLIHEMDALVSPEVMWRYIDQLRIPGSN